ncbi:hypothetical protein LUZ63_015562 [Rhynchospora breviuscula]|uniref:Nuclear transcription factor Y subunit n=1 Tax=Rhynchospora breviuscula TaxID=2022672 RepID=A0A9Q0HM90_9POAL|nr:hypothetical protein LUZ63_015562 [Rhynchospora breviuscula]
MSSTDRDASDNSDSEQDQTKSESQDQNPAFSNGQTMFVPPHVMGQLVYPNMDPYYASMYAAYAGPPLVPPPFVGMQPTIPLPTEAVEEPVYVNAKQYNAILRRRQSRAKAESENKLIKVRKPYLHESRHLHALKRARGSGGRFVNANSNDEKDDTSKNDESGEGQDGALHENAAPSSGNSPQRIANSK